MGREGGEKGREKDESLLPTFLGPDLNRNTVQEKIGLHRLVQIIGAKHTVITGQFAKKPTRSQSSQSTTGLINSLTANV